MTQISDALWAPLRTAVPSFDARWEEYVASPGYNAAEAGVNVHKFTYHLADLIRRDGLGTIAGLLTAMEACYSWVSAHEDDAGALELERIMTISILEYLIQTAEDAGHDLRDLAGLLPGPLTRAAWQRALDWTHPECSWDWERGLVFHEPPPRCVGRFRVTGSFFLAIRNAVVVHGELIEGSVTSGNVLRLRLSAGSHIEGRIGAIEWMRTSTGEEMGLLLPLGADRDPVTEEAMWSGLEGEVLDIAELVNPAPSRHN